jgi:hypothetical protein
MAVDIDEAITQIVTVLRTVSGIENVPLNPPSLMSYSTFGLVYPFSGTYTMGAPTGVKEGLHNIAIDILTTDTDFAKALARLRPLIGSVSLRLGREISYDSNGNPGQQFSNSIDTFSELTYSWMPVTDFGGVPVVGLHFVMNDTKIQVDL